MAQGLSRVSRPTAAELLNTPEGLEWRHVHYSLARLESTKRSSIILAAFCFAVFASLQVSIPTACPIWLSLLLALNTAILILMHSFAFLVSVFMLPKLQAVVHEYTPPRDGDVTMKPVPSVFSPHHKFRGIVEVSYNISHVLGLFLYLIEIVLLSWVKFWDFSYAACLASTICMVPFLALFVVFCWYFNRVLSKHVYETRSDMLESVARDYAEPDWTLSEHVSSRNNLDHATQDHRKHQNDSMSSRSGSRNNLEAITQDHRKHQNDSMSSRSGSRNNLEATQDHRKQHNDSSNVSMSPKLSSRNNQDHIKRHNDSMSSKGSRYHLDATQDHNKRQNNSSKRPNESSTVSMSPEGSRTNSLTQEHANVNQGHTNRGFIADIHALDTD